MEEQSQIERVVLILESTGGFRPIERTPLVGEPFQFDAVLRSSDPLTVVVIEYKSNLTEDSLKGFSRQLESFVWSLYSHNKRHMVSAVLLSATPVPAKARSEVVRNLNGICRLFLVDAKMSDEEIRSTLLSLCRPKFTHTHLSKIHTSNTIDALIEGAPNSRKTHLRAVLEISEKANDVEEVREQLVSEFRRLLREAQDALEKPSG
jgi:hypothetical protein